MSDQTKCDHKFVDSTSCLKCGWTPTQISLAQAAGYVAGIEYSKCFAILLPNNCAVIERTADGVNVGTCTFFLKGGTTCPRHGVVKHPKSNDTKL